LKNLKKRDCLEDSDIGGTLKWILKKQDRRWTRFSWLRIGTNEHNIESFGSVNMKFFY
jgi:hypothetical protein